MSEATQQPARQPEKKIGPFSHGLGVAIWRNTIETKAGPRPVRSVTIAPRRYRGEDGQWKDSTSYRPIDLPTIILALEKAYEFCQSTPLGDADESGEIPF
jgi:hypothetical protein